MADLSTIRCRNCGTELPAKTIRCSNSQCGRNPRAEPVHVGSEPHAAPCDLPVGDPTAGPAREPAAASFAPTAVTITLPNHDHVVLAPGGRLVLGRESPNEAVARAFPKEYVDVSRHHVRLVNDEGGLALVMLGDTGGGTGGTFIDDRRLPNEAGTRVPLAHGERFRLGALAWCKVEVFES